MRNIIIAACAGLLVSVVALLRARHLRRRRPRLGRSADRDPAEEVAASLRQLATVNTPEASSAASARVRNAIGKDHCGVLSPAAVPAVGCLVDIAVNGPEPEGRLAAVGVLLDIFWWDSDEDLGDAFRREVVARADTLSLAAGTESAGSSLRDAFAELLGEVEEYSRQLRLGVQAPTPLLRRLTVSKELAEVIGNGPLPVPRW